MKTSNPKNRFALDIGRRDSVLEVGGGHNPHPRANVVVDKYVDSNYHRHTDIKVLKHQRFVEADGEHLPFADGEFDYVICNQVLEHVNNPSAFLAEQSRVAPRGYIETPSLVGEYLFPKEAHKWLVLEIDNRLVLVEKQKFWFATGLDFGYLFLIWFQKTSVAYKILMDTKPNFMTVRHQWQGSIDHVVNPDDQHLLDYFVRPWTPEMVMQFFPRTSPTAEVWTALCSLAGIVSAAVARRASELYHR
jgi:SAM-dependent methyltransferase